jgi:hypothetical protein
MFEVLTAASPNTAVFWVVAPCSRLEIYQRYRSACCLSPGRHLWNVPDHTAQQPNQKTAIFTNKLHDFKPNITVGYLLLPLRIRDFPELKYLPRDGYTVGRRRCLCILQATVGRLYLFGYNTFFRSPL